MRSYPVFYLALVLVAIPAHALGPVRCYGRVQFRPCQLMVDLPPAKRRTQGARLGVPATVTAQSFQQLSTLRGRWQGKIQGHGLISVWLHILKGKVPIEQTYLGDVPMTDKDGPVPFDYIGPLPKEKSWTWKVVAVAHPFQNS